MLQVDHCFNPKILVKMSVLERLPYNITFFFSDFFKWVSIFNYEILPFYIICLFYAMIHKSKCYIAWQAGYTLIQKNRKSVTIL